MIGKFTYFYAWILLDTELVNSGIFKAIETGSSELVALNISVSSIERRGEKSAVIAVELPI